MRTFDGRFRIRVAAPPIEGRANKRLVTILAKWLELPPSHVAVVRGAGGRHKVVEIEGLTLAEVLERLGSVSTAS